MPATSEMAGPGEGLGSGRGESPSVGVILPAGGKGLRLGAPEPKQFLQLEPGRPLLRYSLETFHALPQVGSIALVLPAERMELGRALAAEFPKLVLAEGGAERWQSVKNGFDALTAACDTVLIHDAARPFVTATIIEACLAAVGRNRAVTVAVPMTDTVKEVSGAKVLGTLDRSRLVRVQTPQGFPRAMLEALYRRPPGSAAPTDEAQMAEALGFPMAWVRGEASNAKVTEAEDWEWAKWMAAKRNSGRE